MSLSRQAAGSFAWASAASLGARLLTLVSTFVLTRYLSPAVLGEVNLAFVLVATAGMATSLGVAQHVAAHPGAGKDTAFHGSVLVLGMGVVACLVCALAAPHAAALLGTPGMAQYVPGLALAHYMDRCTWVPRGLLVRDMRFRALALRTAAGELTFAVSTVLFARAQLGGHAIVLGNIARGAVCLSLVLAATGVRGHLTPCKLSWRKLRDILGFGAPLTAGQLFRLGATSWDNTFIGMRFGEAAVGVYNQAYRLGDLPATSVGDQLNDVLVPAFARQSDREARIRGFLRAASLLALIIFPMALGLSVTSTALVEVFYPPEYAAVGPFLRVLAVIGIARAFLGLSSAFLQAARRTRPFARNELLLVVSVLGLMALFARFGAVASACGVALAFFLGLGVSLRALRPEGITLAAVLAAVARPFCAAAAMVVVVALCGLWLTAAGVSPGLRLALEIAVGALAYAGAAWLAARAVVLDLLALAAGVVRRDSAPCSRRRAGRAMLRR